MKLNGKNNNLILFLAGFVYIIAAIAVLLLPFDDAYFNMLVNAVAICVVGILLIFSYLINKKWFFKPGWILSQGMFCVVIAVMLFLNSYNMLMDNVSILLAFWALLSAVTQISTSIQIKYLQFQKWQRLFFAGLFNLIIFAFILINPFSEYLTDVMMTCYYMIFSAITILAEPFSYNK